WHIVTLKGNGVASTLIWSPNPLDFGEVDFPSQAARQVTFSNIGHYDAEVTGISIVSTLQPAPWGSQFWGDLTPFNVPAGSEAVVNLGARPLNGLQMAEFDFQFDLPPGSGALLLSAHGAVPVIAVNPPSIDF